MKSIASILALAGVVPIDRESGLMSLNARMRGVIESDEELAACEHIMREPRLSREVYDELNGLVKAYKAKVQP